MFTGVAQELALLLWQRCGHLGCNVPGDQCEVDHIAEWDADDGPTYQSNAHPRCDTHNPFKSEHRLRSVRDPDGYIVDYRANGTPMLPAGRRPPDEQPAVNAGLPHVGSAWSPTGEGMSGSPVHRHHRLHGSTQPKGSTAAAKAITRRLDD